MHGLAHARDTRMKVLLMAMTQAKHDMDRLTMWPSPVGLTSMTAHCKLVRHPLQVLDMTFSAPYPPRTPQSLYSTARSAWAVAV